MSKAEQIYIRVEPPALPESFSKTTPKVEEKSSGERVWKAYEAAVSACEITSYVVKFVEKVQKIAEPVLELSEPLMKGLEDVSCLKHVTIIGLPGTVKELVGGVKQVCSGKGVEAKTEGVLKTVTSIGSLGDHASTVAEVLHKAEAITKVSAGAIAWTAPLGIVTSLLSAVSIGLAAIGLNRSSKFLVKFQKKVFLHSFTAIKDDDLKSQLNISKTKCDKIRKRLSEVTDVNEIKLTRKLLKGRVKDKIFSYRLSILISVISLVALGVLLFTPLAPVAYALTAAGIILSIGKLIYEKVQKRHFKEYMSLNKVRSLTKVKEEGQELKIVPQHSAQLRLT